MDNIELKNCPFCGGKAYITNGERWVNFDDMTEELTVQCGVCNATITHTQYISNKPGFISRYPYTLSAVELWNRRVKE